MAVQILNDMPDAAVHRGDAEHPQPREAAVPSLLSRVSGRAVFLAGTMAVHVAGAAIFIGTRVESHVAKESEPMVATIIEASRPEAEAPAEYVPPPVDVVYALQTPPELTFESDAITPDATTTAISTPQVQAVAPPLVESIDYVRVVKPVFPRESARKREYGTVVLRVLVDTQGKPAQIQIERSSGYPRLDSAALKCVEKFLFHPHEVNGVSQPAQVLIPVGFDPPA
jgi:TonB family protein